jgi:UDP-glucose 4-epimerase
MKSLVTGGAGFIGSHLVDELVRRGDEVVVLDRLHPKHPNSRASYYLQDLAADYRQYTHHFEGVDQVFHLAALIAIPYCMEHPSESMTNNVLAVMHTLEAARMQGVKRFALGSSAAVYGNSLFLPSVETNAPRCMNTYALSKHTGEQLCCLYHELYGMRTVIMRYFNVYGNRQHESGQYAPVMGVFLRQMAMRELRWTDFSGQAPSLVSEAGYRP